MSSTCIVGIDLGSLTARCSELSVSRRMPTVIRSKLSNESTPTVAFFPPSGEGERQFGEAVATKDITTPASTVADMKVWLLEKPNENRTMPGLLVKGEDASLACGQALGFILSQILLNAPSYKAYLNDEGSNANSCAGIVIAVPTAFAKNGEISTIVSQAARLSLEKKGSTTPFSARVVDEADALVAYFHHLRYESHDDAPVPTVIVNVGHNYTSVVLVKAVKGSVERIASASIPCGSGVIEKGLCDIVFENILSKQKRDIRGHTKSYKKVLRECKKAKEILSSVDTAKIQLEGLAEDTDVAVQLTRVELVACGSGLLNAIRDTIAAEILPLVADEVTAGTVRLECVGGGWRSPFLQDYLKATFNVPRVGVTLDSNLCVSEGCAILGAMYLFASAAEEERAVFDPIHGLSFPCALETTQPPAAPEVPAEWVIAEATMAEADAKFLAFSSAVDKLQSLIYGTQSLLGRCPNAKDETYAALSALLNEIDALAADETTTTEKLLATYDEMEAKVNAVPEVAAQKAKEAEEKRKKEEEFSRLAKLQEEDKELKSDPQRLRVAQQRREQGAALFKQECWEEAQTRFVQALSIIGQLYDTTSEENKTKKHEISLSCYLNIASCCVKLGRWRIAISNCTNALDVSPNNAKALFRRGQAYSAQGDYAEAMADLTKAKELTNDDAGVVAEIEHLKKKMEAEKAREKKMYGKMFA